MKFSRTVPVFLLFLAFGVLFAPRLAAGTRCATEVCLAQSVPARTATPEAESGNDTLKLATLGVVFLLIGAAVVYAPQIVAAISGFPRRLAGKPRKKSPPPKAPAKASASRTEEVRLPTPSERPPLPPPVVLPGEPVTIRVAEPDDVVTQLQSEVRSAWSRTR